MESCLICRAAAVRTLLEFGEQALSNRFLSRADAPEETFPFTLGQCASCGLLQLLSPTPARELKARFDWIAYNEAEGHLDQLVSKVCRLPGISTASTVGAVSSKDDSIIARFQKLGFAKSWRLQLDADLGVADAYAALETVQEELTPEKAAGVAARRGLADVLIVRHILEHAHQPHRFAAALRAMIKSGGYFIFEVPDCTPALRNDDYTMPWEEHIVYYTPELLTHSLVRLGFKVVSRDCYPYANENSLVVIAQAAEGLPVPESSSGIVDDILKLGGHYASAFESYQRQVVEKLVATRREQGAIAMFGAGHLSCAWINFLRIEQLIDLVVDDHPKKKGLFMPGSRLPICPSSELLNRGVIVCLTSLSAESEAKVMAKNQPFLERGGRFASIFPGRPNSFLA